MKHKASFGRRTLDILPIDHAFAHTVNIHAPLLRGLSVHILEMMSGRSLRSRAESFSAWVKPGRNAWTMTPVRASSTAGAAEKTLRNAFVAEYMAPDFSIS